MDDHDVHLLEDLFQEKIILYNDLVNCLEKEKESLINIDLEALWSISKEKEEICSKIESARQEIVSVAKKDVADDFLPLSELLELITEEKTDTFQKFSMTLFKLKSNIELLRKENMIFMDDSLHFLDEMISIITGESESRIMYNGRCHISKSGFNCLLSREA